MKHLISFLLFLPLAVLLRLQDSLTIEHAMVIYYIDVSIVVIVLAMLCLLWPSNKRLKQIKEVF